MEAFEQFIFVVNNALDTSQKRHIVGGIMLSLSLLFGGLAVTTMTIKGDKK